MLAIGRALMSRPKLLLLDEPSLGLAPLVVKQIFSTLADINKRDGTTVFLVEQNAHMALRLANRGYVLVNGRIILSGTGAELLANPDVRAAYLEARLKARLKGSYEKISHSLPPSSRSHPFLPAPIFTIGVIGPLTGQRCRVRRADETRRRAGR